MEPLHGVEGQTGRLGENPKERLGPTWQQGLCPETGDSFCLQAAQAWGIRCQVTHLSSLLYTL